MKRGLMVAINNYPGTGNDLSCCINDAHRWGALLTNRFGYEVDYLLDEQATKANILVWLNTVCVSAKWGDDIVFAYSGHGTYIQDYSGDEPVYDEAIVPYDFSNGVLVDDELRQIFAPLPDGISLAVIFDSCFSGTATRYGMLQFFPSMFSIIESSNIARDRRKRFMDPVHIFGRTLGVRDILKPFKAKPRKRMLYPQASMNELLLSGCRDDEYSYEDGALGHGAFTYYATQIIGESGDDLTYRELIQKVNRVITGEFSQHPQLEGKSYNKSKRVFR